ncbi:MAG: HsdM family class I SAM-dependent methyltransferase [Ferrimicrobium sp.]
MGTRFDPVSDVYRTLSGGFAQLLERYGPVERVPDEVVVGLGSVWLGRQGSRALEGLLPSEFRGREPDPALRALLAEMVASVESEVGGLGVLYESICETLSPDFRQGGGVVYTPLSIARDISLQAAATLGAGTLMDPSCGCGVFLEAAMAEVPATRRAAFMEQLAGIDSDPAAVVLARVAMAARVGDTRDAVIELIRRQIVVGDALDSQVVLGEGVTASVVGNPPFLSPRFRRSQLDGDRYRWLRTRFSGLIESTTDLSTVFVIRSVQLVAPKGMVRLILPRSFLSAQGAALTRGWLESVGTVHSVVALPVGSFRAQVASVVLTYQRNGDTLSDAQDAGPTSWGRYISDAPMVKLADSPSLDSLAVSTGSFRDEYYELARMVREDDQDKGFGFQLVTVGTLELGRSAWGERPIRFAKQSWAKPVIPTDLHWSRALRRQQRPKVLVPPQKPILQPVMDEWGTMVASTPVVTVWPLVDGSISILELAAVIGSPVAAAFIDRRCAGTALSLTSMKFAARDLGEIPLPLDRGWWQVGAKAFGEIELDPEMAMDRYGEAMCQSYRLSSNDTKNLLAWWKRRWRRSKGGVRT